MFGLRVTGVSRAGKACPEFDRVVATAHLHQAVSDADYVVAVLPDTDAARHVLDSRAFDAMTARPMLINVGRGSSIHTQHLLQALREERVRAAVLDVFTTEPLPSHSPLWLEPRVSVTPHVAAVSYPRDIAAVFLANLERFRRGGELEYVVDLVRGY